MVQPTGKRLPPSRAKAARQAAALVTHWRDKASEGGEVAVLAELETEDDWFQIVMALLCVIDGIIKAGPMGMAEEYVATVLREAMLDEVADV
jgi:hypothetical protein